MTEGLIKHTQRRVSPVKDVESIAMDPDVKQTGQT